MPGWSVTLRGSALFLMLSTALCESAALGAAVDLDVRSPGFVGALDDRSDAALGDLSVSSTDTLPDSRNTRPPADTGERSVDASDLRFQERQISRWFSLIQYLLSFSALYVGALGVVLPTLLYFRQRSEHSSFKEQSDRRLSEIESKTAEVRSLTEHVRQRAQEADASTDSIQRAARKAERAAKALDEKDESATEATGTEDVAETGLRTIASQGQYDDAGSEGLQSDTTDSQIIDPLRERAQAAASAGQYETALRLWMTVLDLVQNDIAALAGAADAAHELAEQSDGAREVDYLEQSVRHYRLLVELQPTVGRRNNFGMVLGDLADRLAQREEYERSETLFYEAEEVLTKTYEENQHYEKAIRNLAATLVDHSNLLKLMRRTDEGLVMADRAVDAIERAYADHSGETWRLERRVLLADHKFDLYMQRFDYGAAEKELVFAEECLEKLRDMGTNARRLTAASNVLLVDRAMLADAKGQQELAASYMNRLKNLD